MINKELKSVMDYMEREKGLDREVLIETIKSSLQSAARKSVTNVVDPIIDINPDTFEVSVHEKFLVISDSDIPKANEIILSKAKNTNPDAKVGEHVLLEVTPDDFGRIAAQTAKQVIIHKLRDAQADVIYNEYKDKVFTILSGTVRNNESKNIVIDLGRGEAILKPREQIENEEYRIGDRLRCLIIEVRKSSGNPEILVSRSHPLFIKKLFELEVPEITDGVVEIKGIAREAGFRTKIAVYSKDPKVDCVGACVGMRGSRVKNIVQELNGEKIDIIPWSQDVATFCRNAMNPAKLKHVAEDHENKSLQVFVDKSQFSLAIGKKGHNARLTSKLIGYKIDIEVVEEDKMQEIAKKMPRAGKKSEQTDTIKESEIQDIPIDEIEGLNNKVKEYFKEAGYQNLSDLKNIHIDELYSIPGVGKTSAEEIIEIISKSIKERNNS
ncbi:MAG: hypothetical protein ACD_79C00460G0002 [uncultured bacterium]|nr:MAG: hypothetical protein ACD_79C00460G0002 [uncultured bacterium]